MTSKVHSHIHIVEEAALLIFSGILDGDTYRTVRDLIVKTALDEPRAVLVEIAQSEVPAKSPLAVFTSARWQINRWPGIPLALICQAADGRDSLARNGIGRYIPVHASVPEALAALPHTGLPLRRRRHADFSDSVDLDAARELVAGWLNEPSRTNVMAAAKIVVTILMESALEHTIDGPTSPRLEARNDEVTIAVADTSALPPNFKEAALGGTELTGLKILDAVARTLGCSGTPGGKVVWGVLAPDNRP
jgi:hypothetical protein